VAYLAVKDTSDQELDCLVTLDASDGAFAQVDVKP
jgi:hypothetical protein